MSLTIDSTSSNPSLPFQMLSGGIAGFIVGGFLAVILGRFLVGGTGIELGVLVGTFACSTVLGPLIPLLVAKVRESLNEHKKHPPCEDVEN